MTNSNNDGVREHSMSSSVMYAEDKMSVPISISVDDKMEAIINSADAITAKALTKVVNLILSDAFNVDPEESIWIGESLRKAFKPLTKITPDNLLGAVRSEIKTGNYTNKLATRQQQPNVPTETQEGVTYGLLSDWLTAISEIVFSSYPDARPMITSRVIGSIHGVLSEMGLTNDLATCRPSNYLPNSIRHILNSK